MSLVLAVPTAAADTRCDCSVNAGQCLVDISLTGQWFQLRTNTPRCALVGWRTDGSGRNTTVIDGEELIENLGATPSRITVDFCDVCRDRSFEQRGASVPATTAWFDGTPVQRFSPEYPPTAQSRGIEGHGVVSADVTPDGRVTGPRVVNAQPAGVFDAAAVAANSRWRFRPSDSGGTTKVLFRFELTD